MFPTGWPSMNKHSDVCFFNVLLAGCLKGRIWSSRESTKVSSWTAIWSNEHFPNHSSSNDSHLYFLSQFVFQLPLRQWKRWFSIILVETGEGNFTWQWKKQPFENVFPLKDGESNNFSTLPPTPDPSSTQCRGWLRNNEVPKGKVSAGPYRQLGPSEVRQLDDAAVIFLSVTRVGLKKKNVICRFVFEGSNPV